MLAKRLQDASKGSLTYESAKQTLASMADGDWSDDIAMIDFYTNKASLILEKTKSIRNEALKAQMDAIKEEMEQESS